MPVISTCPDIAILQQLALGQMPPKEVERLAQHCEQCPRCIQVLHSLKAEDTLIEAMAAQGTAPDQSRDALVNALIERLKRLPSPSSAEGEMTATVALGPTPSVDVPPAAIEQTVAGDISLAPAQSPDEIGRLGGYRVLKILGAGGMGMVYHAEDVHLQRPIALKVMKPEVSNNSTARERFLREARAAAKLKSDHVVNIYQVGEERQVVFLAMEFLEGMSLDDWLKKGRKPTVAQAARIGRQIALGLADAHACGLIHRDIKPANIWLDSLHQGRVKLLDFGLARADKEEHQLTQSGAIIGTPAYMAPEQARGEYVDHRSDLFSLGVVLYRLTTGQLPFRGDNTMSILTSLALDTPKSPREIDADIPPRLASLIEQLLAKNREQRPKTAKAVADELAAIEREATQGTADDRTINVRAASAAPVVRAAHAAQRSKRFRWLIAASLLVLLGGVTAAIVVIIRDKQGNKIAEMEVPSGGKIEIQDNGNGKTEAKAPPALRQEVKIAAAPLPPLRPREPLSPTTLVRQPAKLPGVRSWTIEKRDAPSALIAAFRPDGKRLAVGSLDGSVRIWEPETGRLVQVLLDQGDVRSLAWSPDGRVLAVGDWELGQPIRLCEAETGCPLRTLVAPNPLDRWSQLAWSPDGRKVLASRYSDWVVLDAVDGKMLHRFPLGHGLAGAFSPDGKFVAGWEDSRSGVVIWDAETGKQVRTLTGVEKGDGWPNWSPDGKHLGYGGSNGTFVWEASTGKQIIHCQDVKSPSTVIWSPDGRMWASFGGGAPRLLGLGNKEQGQVQEYSGPFSPDGQFVVSLLVSFGAIHLYNPSTGKRLRSLSDGNSTRPFYFRLSPDGRTVATFIGGQTVLTSVDTGQVVARLKDTGPPLAWSPDGKRLATGGPNHTVLIWEDGFKVRIVLSGHRQDVTWLAWSPDGKRLASSSEREKRLLLWDAAKGEHIREFGPAAVAKTDIRWSPDGRLLAFHVPDEGRHVWDVEQNKLVNNPKQWNAKAFQFAPDGRSALAACYDPPDYRLRDLVTNEERGRLPFNGTQTTAPPVWSPDGHLLAVSVGATIELWRGDLSRRVRTLKATQNDVEQAAFSADGKLVAGRAGERLHVWETDTGRLRGILLLGEKDNGLTIAADGHYIGNEQVERGIVVVVQKDDGTQEVLEPADFEAKYGWKNDPGKVHLLQPLPPPLYPLPGMPMGPYALVREPAELPDANAMSWTIETVNARGTVRAVAYRSDGKLLATGGEDGTIRIWDTTNGRLVRMLIRDPVDSLAWSKDGKLLAAAAWGWGYSLWEMDTGRLLRRLPIGLNARIMAWSPDGTTLALFDGGNLCLWDRSTDRIVHSHPFPPVNGQPVNGQGLAWSPHGKTLAVGLTDNTVRFWDVPSWKENSKMEGLAADWTGIAWSPDGKRLVTATHQGKSFSVWDTVIGKRQGQFALPGQMGMSPGVAWMPDGKAVAVDRFGLFSPDSGQLLRSLEEGEAMWTAVWSPDGKQAATAGSDGVRLYDAATGKRTHTLEDSTSGGIYSLNWSPDGGSLAVGTNFPMLPIVEAATGRSRPGLAEYERAGVWSPDGKIFATCGHDGRAHLLAAGTYRHMRTLEGDGGDGTGLAWSADGKLLAQGAHSGLRVWSAETGKQLWQKDKRAIAVAWSPRGRRLATTDNSNDKAALRIWEAETGNLLQEFPLIAEGALAWSPDGKRLVALPMWGEEGLMIDAETGAVHRKLKAGAGNCGVRWSSDGKTFTSLGNQGQVREWSAAAGEIQRTWQLPGVQGFISCAAWSPAGRVLAWASGIAIHLHTADGYPLGAGLPFDPFGHLVVTADGRHRGNARVERQIRMVVQKSDGTTETLTPREFEQKYNFKNDPAQVRLIDK